MTTCSLAAPPEWPTGDPLPKDVLLYDGSELLLAVAARDPMPPHAVPVSSAAPSNGPGRCRA